MNKILIIIPYFGHLPKNFSAFLDSCRLNGCIDFILFTDDELDGYSFPSNFTVVKSTLEDIRNLCPIEVRNALLIPYKLCDYKPLYGEMFADYLKGYDFWGYCDVDFLFGKLETYLKNINLDNYDRLFDLGHLTIYRNREDINRLWRKKYSGQRYVDSVEYVFNTTLSCNFDECHMNKTCEEFLKERWLRGQLPYIDIAWRYPYFRCGDISKPQLFVHFPDGRLFRFVKDNGIITREEFFYIHMIRRTFLEIDNVILQDELPYLITHKGFISYDEKFIDNYFTLFSYPTQEEIAERQKSFDYSLQRTKINKIRMEIQMKGMLRGGINIVTKIIYDHLLHLK